MAERNGFTELYNGARRHWDQYEVPFIFAKGAGPCGIEEARLPVDRARVEYQQLRRANTYTAKCPGARLGRDQTKLWLWPAGAASCRCCRCTTLNVPVSTAEQGEMVARLGCDADLEVPMRVGKISDLGRRQAQLGRTVGRVP
jgi:hypothetical protein